MATQGGRALEAMVLTYRKTSDISCTFVGNKIVDHSDVVGAPPVGAAPTTSSFSTASMDWANTTTRRNEKHLILGDFVELILEVWRYVYSQVHIYSIFNTRSKSVCRCNICYDIYSILSDSFIRFFRSTKYLDIISHQWTYFDTHPSVHCIKRHSYLIQALIAAHCSV